MLSHDSAVFFRMTRFFITTTSSNDDRQLRRYTLIPANFVLKKSILTGIFQLQIQILDELIVPLSVFENRIDKHGFSTVGIAQEIRVGAANCVEKLEAGQKQKRAINQPALKEKWEILCE